MMRRRWRCILCFVPLGGRSPVGCGTLLGRLVLVPASLHPRHRAATPRACLCPDQGRGGGRLTQRGEVVTRGLWPSWLCSRGWGSFVGTTCPGGAWWSQVCLVPMGWCHFVSSSIDQTLEDRWWCRGLGSRTPGWRTRVVVCLVSLMAGSLVAVMVAFFGRLGDKGGRCGCPWCWWCFSSGGSQIMLWKFVLMATGLPSGRAGARDTSM